MKMRNTVYPNFFKSFIAIIGFSLLLIGCSAPANNEPTDTYDSGTIHISVDESFKPVIDSQIRVYESSFPDTKIIPHYKPEADCFKDFAVDSIRMIIVTRPFSEAEEQFMIDSMKVAPDKKIIAFDAIAIIVNPGSSDSLFTVQEIKDILKGNYKKTLIPVFDGLNATSTVRYVIDSILNGETLSANAKAARTSEDVLNFVAGNKNTIGFIGVNWIGNKEDSTQLSFLNKVKVAHIESTDKPGGYVVPVQANIYGKRYPFVRDLFYILKERHRGLGHGFANFLSGERGQLIFRRAYLVPGQMNFEVRKVTMRN
jgi:phosphate transport system substrate-binding protein